jgi:hypothetical protein
MGLIGDFLTFIITGFAAGIAAMVEAFIIELAQSVLGVFTLV